MRTPGERKAELRTADNALSYVLADLEEDALTVGPDTDSPVTISTYTLTPKVHPDHIIRKIRGE